MLKMLFYQWFMDALKSLLIQNKLKYIAKEQYLRVLEVSLTAKKNITCRNLSGYRGPLIDSSIRRPKI